MPGLSIFITENVPTSLRMDLTRWMIEIKTGIFIGTLSGYVRAKLWEKLCKKLKNGCIIMVKSADNEQGFEITMSGQCHRRIVNFEGIQLIKIPFKPRKNTPVT